MLKVKEELITFGRMWEGYCSYRTTGAVYLSETASAEMCSGCFVFLSVCVYVCMGTGTHEGESKRLTDKDR